MNDFFSKYPFCTIGTFSLGSKSLLSELEEVIEKGISNKMNWEFYDEYCDALIKFKKQTGLSDKDIRIIEIAQFHSASISLNILMSMKNFLAMYDLVVKAFSSELVTEKENVVEYGKVAAWIKEEYFEDELLFLFFKPLYYYDTYFRNVFSDITECFKTPYEARLFTKLTEGDYGYVQDICMYLSWCNNYNHKIFQDKGKVTLLTEIVDKEVFPCEYTIELGILLITQFGEKCGLNVKDKAKILYDKYNKHFWGHQGLQVLSSIVSYDYNELKVYLSPIDKELSNYLDYIDKAGMDTFQLFNEKSRIFKSIYNIFILNALRGNDQNVAIELISKWKKRDFLTNEKTLLIFPNVENGVQLSTELVINDKHKESFSEVIDSENKCLQLQSLNNVVENIPLEKAERFGQPLPEYGQLYEDTLENFYQFSKWKLDQEFEYMVSFDQPKHPLQALMLKYLGSTYPMNVSFESRKDEKHIQKILFWYTGETFSSEVEKSVMTSICQSYGVDLLCINGDELENTKDEFNKHYTSDDYDLLILSSHGEVNHFDPKKSEVLLSNTCLFDLRELPKVDFDKKRTLFLNLCDACSNYSMGADGALSFGSVVTCSSQNVIGHLWPVNPLYAVFVSLIFLKNCLHKDQDSFTSYKETIRVLLGGKEGMKTFFDDKKIFLDIGENVENSSVDFGNIVNWGSLAFFR